MSGFSTTATSVFTSEETDFFRAVFDEIDLDDDGHLDKHEFAKFGTDVLGASPANIQQAFDMVDMAGDGRITFPDFLTFLEEYDDLGVVMLLCKRFFNFFDLNGDNTVTKEEYEWAVNDVVVVSGDYDRDSLHTDEVNVFTDNAAGFFHNADLDSNDSMSYFEFTGGVVAHAWPY